MKTMTAAKHTAKNQACWYDPHLLVEPLLNALDCMSHQRCCAGPRALPCLMMAAACKGICPPLKLAQSQPIRDSPRYTFCDWLQRMRNCQHLQAVSWIGAALLGYVPDHGNRIPNELHAGRECSPWLVVLDCVEQHL